MKKRLLILGGADIQISAIEAAKDLGLEVITCDYLPNNPGHTLSDAYYNVSTTDKEAVLELAKQLEIDGISAYASDPGALTAAYVSDHLNIPGNTFEQVQRLSDKVAFRGVLRKLGLPSPEHKEVSTSSDVLEFQNQCSNGVILKPADTSGSKGIVHIRDADIDKIETIIDTAKSFSRSKKIIVEEYIQRVGNVISGDFIIEKGKILFASYGDVHFNDRINGLVPRSITLPSTKSKSFQDAATAQLQKIIDEVGIETGVFNADVLENQEGIPVIVDIGARNGGNFFNDIIYFHSGVNLIDLSIKQCVGLSLYQDIRASKNDCYAHCVIHSEQEGIYQGVEFSETLESKIIHKALYKSKGDKVVRFINSSARIGLVLLHFSNFDEMMTTVSNMHNHVTIELN